MMDNLSHKEYGLKYSYFAEITVDWQKCQQYIKIIETTNSYKPKATSIKNSQEKKLLLCRLLVITTKTKAFHYEVSLHFEGGVKIVRTGFSLLCKVKVSAGRNNHLLMSVHFVPNVHHKYFISVSSQLYEVDIISTFQMNKLRHKVIRKWWQYVTSYKDCSVTHTGFISGSSLTVKLWTSNLLSPKTVVTTWNWWIDSFCLRGLLWALFMLWKMYCYAC